MLLGAQQAPPTIDPSHQRTCFDSRLVDLVRVLADADHPLVLFLDDLQWVDPASLRIIGKLLNDPTVHNLLLIGAYRADEVADAHPLTVALGQWDTGRSVTISLDSLGEADLAELVADSTESSLEDARPLAALLQQKTGGNPFYVEEVIRSLIDSSVVVYDEATGQWEATRRVEDIAIPDTLAERMQRRLELDEGKLR